MNHSTEGNVHHQLVEQLAERLAAAERSLASARAEIAQLRRGSRQSWSARCAWIAVGVTAIFITAMLSRSGVTHAQETGQRVSAPFVVMGSGGQTLFRVKEYDNGNQACLFGSSAKPVSCLITTEYGGLVMSAGNDMEHRTSMGVDDNGNGGLILWDAGKKPIADILVGPKGGRGLAVYDSNGNQKILVSTTSQDVGQVLVETEGMVPEVGLAADKAGSEGFRGAFVWDDSKNPVAEMIANSEGLGAVRALQGDGGSDAALYADKDTGGLLIRNNAGQIVAEATQRGFNYFGSGGNHTAVAGITESDGRGVVRVSSKGGTPLAFLTESDKSGGGNVTLADPGGSGVFSAGYVAEGGANACLDLPKQGLKCFGIGLPMTMSVAK